MDEFDKNNMNDTEKENTPDFEEPKKTDEVPAAEEPAAEPESISEPCPEPRETDTPYQPYSGFEAYKPQNNKSGGVKVLAVILTVVALLALAVAGVMLADRFMGESKPAGSDSVYTLDGPGSKEPENTDDPSKTEKADGATDFNVNKGSKDDAELTRQDIIKQSKLGVVGVSSTLPGGTGVGSGFVYSDAGFIITNNHVIENATAVKVIMSDLTEYDAVVVGGDALSDVAVLKIDADGLKALTMGDSDDVEEGDEVIAIGSPAGLSFSGTCTHGIISAVDREVKMTDYISGKLKKTMKVLQTDAAINTGNSGGPLINSRGQVIGVNSLKLGNGYEGMGFALPINGVTEIADILINEGSISERPENDYVRGTPALGVTVMTVSESDIKSYGWPAGCYVYSVSLNGSAQEAGIRRGDIIVACDGKEVKSNEELVSVISSKEIGDKVTVTVFRDDANVDIEATLKSSES